jgi:hypothetical protein
VTNGSLEDGQALAYLTPAERIVLGSFLIRTMHRKPRQTAAQLQKYGPKGTAYLMSAQILIRVVPVVGLVAFFAFPFVPNAGHVFTVLLLLALLPGVVRLISASLAGSRFRAAQSQNA